MPPDPITNNSKKKDVPQSRKVGSACSGMCGRVDGVDGTVLKVCSGCKVMSYCSTECQRAVWPTHRQYCSKNIEKSLGSFVQRMMADEHPLRQWILMCLVKEFSITKENMCSMARKPLYAEMNIGVEPTDIHQLFRLQRAEEPSAFDHKGVEGIVQVHNIAELARLPSYTNFATPHMMDLWKEVRESMDRTGRGHFPLVILRFIDGFQEHHHTHTVPIFMPAVEEAWKPRSLKEIIPLMVPAQAKPHDISVLEMMNHMNESIRADTKNKLRMRTPFRACDKNLLIDAGYEPDPEYVQIILRSKLLREPVYHSYVLAHPEDAASPLETYVLDHHGKWEAEKERRESLACKLCAKCTCP